jgi:hemin uptake protein HemP
MTAPTTIRSLRLFGDFAGGRPRERLAGWLLAPGSWTGHPHVRTTPESKCCFWYLFRITKVKASYYRLKSFKSTELEVKTTLNWIVIPEITRPQFGKVAMNSDNDDSRNENKPSETPTSPGGERRIRMIENRVDSRELFVETREIMIAHGEDIYRLRLTAQNKLILTK